MGILERLDNAAPAPHVAYDTARGELIMLVTRDMEPNMPSLAHFAVVSAGHVSGYTKGTPLTRKGKAIYGYVVDDRRAMDDITEVSIPGEDSDETPFESYDRRGKYLGVSYRSPRGAMIAVYNTYNRR
jgi:hypothetical protein